MLGYLDVLDCTSVVHALGFLKTLENVIHTAAACTAAEILIRENWTTIKPDARVFQERFVAQLATTTTGTASEQSSYYEKACNKPEVIPRLIEYETPITRTLSLTARQGTRLSLTFGQALTQLKLFDLPEHAMEVKVIVDLPLIVIPAAIVKLFRSEDGSLELIQFLKHLTPAQLYDVEIWCSENATLVTTEHPCELTTPGHWVVDQVMFNVYGFVDKPLPLYFNFTADYIAVIFRHRELPNKWLTESIRSFTLVLDKAKFEISGWACRKKTTYQKSIYYEIPVQRHVNFSRVYKMALEIAFYTKPSVDLQANVLALTQNVLVHSGQHMALKFS